MSEIKPLSPDEVSALRPKHILPEIIEAVNKFLCERFNGKNSVKITRNELVSDTIGLCSKNEKHMTDQILYEKGHLDLESIFEKVGWKVNYESPDRDESFESYYLFTPKRKLP